MAAPLRYPLILLAWGAMAAIYLPLLPAAGELVGAARSPAHWRALFADPQLSQALAATLVSTLLSVGGALLIALTIVAALWPSARWRRLASRLPLLLAVPHLALATAALLLFAEGGWLWQQLPFLTPPVDRYGIGLGLTMALKESAFVLWVIYGLLGEKRLADQATALLEVASGTADAAIIDSLMAGAMIGEGTSYADMTSTVALTSEEYGVGFRKGSDLAATLNEFLSGKYADGSIQTLAETYGVQDALVQE